MEAVSDRPVGVTSRAPAACFLLFGLSDPEEQDQREEEDDCPPSEKASHVVKSGVVTTGAVTQPCRPHQYISGVDSLQAVCLERRSHTAYRMNVVSKDTTHQTWMVLHSNSNSRCELLARTRTEALLAGAELLGCPLSEACAVRLGDF